MENATLQGGVIESNQGVKYNRFVDIAPLNHSNSDIEVIEQFRQAMAGAGIYYAGQIIADGNLHRFHIETHKRGTKNGAYRLHLDNCPAGYFQDFKSGIATTWRASGRHIKITAEQRKQIAKAKHNRQQEILQKQAEAARKAVYIWTKSRPISKGEQHPYLAKKKIFPHIARINQESLVIPIHNQSDQIVNLQFINKNGEKRFLSGGKKQGCLSIIGDLTKKILICEGFATACSLYEHTRQRVVIAFDAGNLLPVAKNIRELSPDSEIILCGDNDETGIGQDKAHEAAVAVKGKLLIPPSSGNDWNDELTGGAHA